MDDQLDNDLRNRIKEVFENFEDTSADEGWLQLRKKYPAGQATPRAFAWIWWGAAAAVLFLFLGIGLWMYARKDQPEKLSGKAPKHVQSKNFASTQTPADTSVKNKTTQTGNSPKTVVDNITATHSNQLKTVAHPGVNIPSKIIESLIIKDTAGKKAYIAKTTDSVKRAIAQIPADQLAVVKPSNNQAKNPEVVKPKAQANQVTVADQSNNQVSNSVVVKPKEPSKSITSMFADNNTEKPQKSIEKSKRVHFGVYAATYFNYAKGSNNQVNIGAGITSDIRISNNLKLVTGVTIAQNSLNFNSAVPTSTAQTSFAVLGTSSSYNAASMVTMASVPAFKNYDANLVGLDIPLNLKYEFNPQKSSTYILAGLSSGTFINETYTYQYNYPALLSPSLQQVQNETSRKSFNGFYLAKTLNVAFGVDYPLGKNRLILEPFLKYPLEGLGSQNIRFGAGGVNLKFNFQSPPKLK
jgi:hypothetical protein